MRCNRETLTFARAQGALLACTPSAGGVQVFSFLELSAHCSLHAHSGALPVLVPRQLDRVLSSAARRTAGSANLAPLLRLAAERPVEALRWSVANQDLVATASLLDCDVHLFDLGVCDDAPTEVLHGEVQLLARSLCVFARVGLPDASAHSMHAIQAARTRQGVRVHSTGAYSALLACRLPLTNLFPRSRWLVRHCIFQFR